MRGINTTDVKIHVHGAQKSRLREFAQSLPAVERGFLTLRWLLSWPHLSTIYSGLANFEGVDHIYYRRYVLEHPDGGNNALDVAVRTEKGLTEAQYEASGDKSLPPRTRYMSVEEHKSFGDSDSGILAVLIHGIAGGSHENYVRRTITAIFERYPEERDVKCIAFNSRGCALSKVTSSKYWSAEQSSDITVTMDFLSRKFPNRKIVAVGFSLGGNILSNYLARVRTESKVTLGISVSNPWHLDICNEYLESSWLGRIYGGRMAAGLQKLFSRGSDILVQKGVDKEEVLAARSLKQFDNAFTAKIFDFADADAYYIAASSGRRVQDVTTNLLILNAKDDPIVVDRSLPYAEVEANPNLCLLASDNGGHIGWYGPGGERWFVDVIVQAIEGVLEERL